MVACILHMFLELKCFICRLPSFECVCIAKCLRKAIHSEMMAAVIDACKMLGACRASAWTYNLKHVVVSSLHQRRVLTSSGRESDGLRDKMPAVKLTIKPAYRFLGSVHVTSGIQQMAQTRAGGGLSLDVGARWFPWNAWKCKIFKTKEGVEIKVWTRQRDTNTPIVWFPAINIQTLQQKTALDFHLQNVFKAFYANKLVFVRFCVPKTFFPRSPYHWQEPGHWLDIGFFARHLPWTKTGPFGPKLQLWQNWHGKKSRFFLV